jgi:hypothetical protein
LKTRNTKKWLVELAQAVELLPSKLIKPNITKKKKKKENDF